MTKTTHLQKVNILKTAMKQLIPHKQRKVTQVIPWEAQGESPIGITSKYISLSLAWFAYMCLCYIFDFVFFSFLRGGREGGEVAESIPVSSTLFIRILFFRGRLFCYADSIFVTILITQPMLFLFLNAFGVGWC